MISLMICNISTIWKARSVQKVFTKSFRHIFEEGLKPYGFCPLERSNIFVRVVNQELLQFIYSERLNAPGLGIYSFMIETSVRTVYMENISNFEIRNGKHTLYQFLSNEERAEIPWQNYCFVYNASNLDEMLQKALQEVIRLIIPVYNDIHTLSDFIEYSLLTQQTDLSFGKFNPEALMWVAAREQIDCQTLAKALIPMMECLRREGLVSSEQELSDCSMEYLQERYINPLNEILNDEEKTAQAEEELKRRRAFTLSFLEKNGIWYT